MSVFKNRRLLVQYKNVLHWTTVSVNYELFLHLAAQKPKQNNSPTDNPLKSHKGIPNLIPGTSRAIKHKFQFKLPNANVSIKLLSHRYTFQMMNFTKTSSFHYSKMLLNFL